MTDQDTTEIAGRNDSVTLPLGEDGERIKHPSIKIKNHVTQYPKRWRGDC